jgi:hypothetical protein
MAMLNQKRERATLLAPNAPGVKDRIDLWYQMSSGLGRPVVKRGMRVAMKTVKALSGAQVVPYISLAIKKDTATSTTPASASD